MRTDRIHNPAIERLEDLVIETDPGAPLPTQRKLVKALGLSSQQVSQTLRAMEVDGLLRRGPNRRFFRTGLEFDGGHHQYAWKTVETRGSSHVWRLRLWRGMLPRATYWFTDGEKALAHYRKTRERTNGLVVTLERAPLAACFEEVARARQVWEPKP